MSSKFVSSKKKFIAKYTLLFNLKWVKCHFDYNQEAIVSFCFSFWFLQKKQNWFLLSFGFFEEVARFEVLF